MYALDKLLELNYQYGSGPTANMTTAQPVYRLIPPYTSSLCKHAIYQLSMIAALRRSTTLMRRHHVYWRPNTLSKVLIHF